MLESCNNCRWMVSEIVHNPYLKNFSRELCMWTNINKDNINEENCPCHGELPKSWRKDSLEI